MKKEAKIYLRNIRLAFPVFRKEEKRFYNDFKYSIYEYDEQHPQYDLDDLMHQFGDPKDIANDYFDNMDSQPYMQLMKRTYYLRILTVLVSLLLITYFFISLYSLQQLRATAKNLLITKEQTTITYEYPNDKPDAEQ